MKTKALNFFILFFVSLPAGAEGFNAFECLRDLMPLTNHGVYQGKRIDVEKPFVIDGKYIVFPEVTARKLIGFFVYDARGAYYYDTIEIKKENGAQSLPIAGLELVKERPLYQMVAQPAGLETVTIYYMPGYDANETNTNGPVALGSSVLPVIGAFVSRPDQYDYVYQSPHDVPENRLQDWLAKNKGGRRPASTGDTKVERRIVSLLSKAKKDEKRLWQPLKEELRLRQSWIKDHNIDNQTFIQIRRLMDGPCKG